MAARPRITQCKAGPSREPERELRSGGRTYKEYEASGNGGQLLIVVPDADLAVVFTAGNYLQGGIWGRWRHTIVADQVIPTIRR